MLKIEVAGFGPHAFSSTAATNALDHDAHVAKVQDWLRHANIATIKVYDRRQMLPEDGPTFNVSNSYLSIGTIRAATPAFEIRSISTNFMCCRHTADKARIFIDSSFGLPDTPNVVCKDGQSNTDACYRGVIKIISQRYEYWNRVYPITRRLQAIPYND